MKAVCLTLSLYDITEHAQQFMKRYGVTYGLAVPQSIADCWQFYMCEYDPKTLPDFVRVDNEINPTQRVGFGLGQEHAADIINWMESNGFAIRSS